MNILIDSKTRMWYRTAAVYFTLHFITLQSTFPLTPPPSKPSFSSSLKYPRPPLRLLLVDHTAANSTASTPTTLIKG